MWYTENKSKSIESPKATTKDDLKNTVTHCMWCTLMLPKGSMCFGSARIRIFYGVQPDCDYYEEENKKYKASQAIAE